jgi:hypothetical protein
MHPIIINSEYRTITETEMSDVIAKAQEKFLVKLTRWAAKNGYKRRGGVWRHEDHYLNVGRETEPIKFFVEKRAYGTGALIERVAI